MMWNQSHVNNGGDFMIHSVIAQLMWKQGVLLVPHPMLHWLMIALAATFNIHVTTAAWMITTVAIVAVPVIVFLATKRLVGTLAALCLTLVSMLAHPIVLWSHVYYIGFQAMTTYHSPTMLLMKPLAFLEFLLVVHVLKHGSRTKENILGALLTLITTITKPSYTMVLLPALGCIVLWRFVRKQSIPWTFLLYSVAIPSVLLISWQLYLTYISPLPNFDSKLVFAPLAALHTHAHGLILKFVLSIAFPAVVIAMYWRDFWRSIPCVLAFLQWVFGTLYLYLLAEGGRRLQDINFSWSANISMAILFLVCLYLVIRKWQEGDRSIPKIAVAGVLLLLHVASGVVWFVSEYKPPHHEVW